MRRIPLSLLLLSTVPSLALAQSVAHYAPVSRTTGNAYVSIAGTGSAITKWRNGTNTDDNRGEAPIGFTFRYMGIGHVDVNVSLNGFLDFDGSTADGSGTGEYGHANTTFSSSATPTLDALAACYDQLTTAGNPNTAASLAASVRYQTTGSAPNRVFIIEWIHMDLAGVAASDLNFQIRLSEQGSILFAYGTMTSGAGSYSYTCGINGLAMSATPLISELLTQQTANTSTFGNAPQNGLTTLPAAGSQLTFVPAENVTPAAPGPLTFPTLGQSSLVLRWTDQSITETFFRVTQSTDGVHFTESGRFQSSSTATTGTVCNFTVKNLVPSTPYTFRVTAENEASAPSPFVTATRRTLPPGIYSIADGNFTSPSTWNVGRAPNAGDTVNVLGGHLVTIDQSITVDELHVGDGPGSIGILQFNATTGCILGVIQDARVDTGSTLRSATSGTVVTHQLVLDNDLVNDGTIDFSTNSDVAGASLRFHTGSQGSVSFTGSGTTDLRDLNVDKGPNVALDIVLPQLSIRGATAGSGVGFLTLHSGDVHFGGTFTLSNPLFSLTAWTINDSSSVWLDNANFTVPGRDGGATLRGGLRVSAGSLGIGFNTATLSLRDAASLTIDGGTVDIVNRLAVSDTLGGQQFTMSGGLLTLGRKGLSGLPAFDMGTHNAHMTMTGGTIEIVTGGANPTYRGVTLFPGPTGGRVRFGNASTPSGQSFFITGRAPSIEVDGTVPGNGLYFSGPVTAAGAVFVDAGATLTLNNQSLTVYDSLVVDGTMIASSGSVLEFTDTQINAPAGAARARPGAWRAAAPGRPYRLTFAGHGLLSGQFDRLTFNTGSNFGFGDQFQGQVVALAVEIVAGDVYNANRLQIGLGNATPSSVSIGLAGFTLQQGDDAVEGIFGSAGGHFMQAPSFQPGTGGYTLNYFATSTPFRTGFEIPPTRTVNDLRMNNGTGVVLTGGDLTVTHDFRFDYGVLTTTPDSMLRLLASVANPAKGSPLAWVNGPVAIGIQTSVPDTVTFPIGRGGYRPLTIEGINTGGALRTFIGQVPPPVIPRTTLPLRRADQARYWKLTAASDLNPQARVRLGFGTDDEVLDFASVRVAQAPAATGVFHSLGGVATGTITSGSVLATNAAAAGENFFTVASETPLIHVIHPDGPSKYVVGAPTSINWKTEDDVAITGIDLFISRTGAGGPFTLIAAGVKDSAFAYVVQSPTSNNVFFLAVLHDALGGNAQDTNDHVIAIINGAVDVNDAPPAALALSPPAPNPVRGPARLWFDLPRAAAVRVSVQDVLGREVARLADGWQPAGRHALAWRDGLPAGLYFVRLVALGEQRVQRVAVVR